MRQLRQRRVVFDFPEGRSANWHPRLGEFAAAANAVSLMMPYVEPFIVRTMRDQIPALERTSPELATATRVYVAQEAQHQAQHRRFNAAVASRVSGVRWVERGLAATFRAFGRRSDRFRCAFAAGSEAGAYAIARWVERHHAELFDGADPESARLFLWHLAEEVEHKDVAFDVWDARFGRRGTLIWATALSLAVLAAFTLLGTILGLAEQRRLFSPVAWWRLNRWAWGFAFSELPNLFAACMPGHHPRQFVDPVWFELYLLGIDRPAGGDDTAEGVSAA